MPSVGTMPKNCSSPNPPIGAMVSRVAPPTAGALASICRFAGVGVRRCLRGDQVGRQAHRRSVRIVGSHATAAQRPPRREFVSAGLGFGTEARVEGIASRMNLEEDVLFLALSSHGSADPSLSVSNATCRCGI